MACASLGVCRRPQRQDAAYRPLAGESLNLRNAIAGSPGQRRKQRPWQESVRVPFLLKYPVAFGSSPLTLDGFLDSPDIMPTLLGLAGCPIPDTVEDRDFSRYLKGHEPDPSNGEGLVACYSPFGEFTRARGGREYRGVLTDRYTYVRTLDGPWLLYDNQEDPYQLRNLADRPECQALQADLEGRLARLLAEKGDRFEPGETYIKQWGYKVDRHGKPL